MLSPDTTYGYRVVATNEVGEAFAEEKTFTTLPGKAPVIESVSISHLTPTDPLGPTVTPGPTGPTPGPSDDGGQSSRSTGSQRLLPDARGVWYSWHLIEHGGGGDRWQTQGQTRQAPQTQAPRYESREAPGDRARSTSASRQGGAIRALVRSEARLGVQRGQSSRCASSLAPRSIRPLRSSGRYSPPVSPSQWTARSCGSTISTSSTPWAA